jgi:hypothetical protein
MLRPMSSEGAKVFLARWVAASASECANSQPFLCELCDILGVARPEPTRETAYAFEYDVTEHHPDGSTTKGRIDLYKRGCFVLESKQFRAVSTAMAAVKEPVTAPEMARRFARARAAEVSEILETLCAVGKARRGNGQGTFLP